MYNIHTYMKCKTKPPDSYCLTCSQGKILEILAHLKTDFSFQKWTIVQTGKIKLALAFNSVWHQGGGVANTNGKQSDFVGLFCSQKLPN